jgi:RHS repeat-associated protein
VSSVSGGVATWQKLTNADPNPDVELWLGTIATTGSSTITVSYTGSVSSDNVELDAQEYTNGTGPTTVWSPDVVGSSNNTTSSTTITFPTLTPSSSQELYVGFAREDNTGEAGSTPGFTYDITSPNANVYIYDPNVSSAVSPTAAQSPAGTSLAVGALITASGSAASTSITDSAWDAVSGGSIPLDVNDATTTSGSSTNVSYIYGDLLFGGTAPLEQITTTSSGATAVFLVAIPTGVQGVFSSTGSVDELAIYSVYGRQTIASGSKITTFGFQGSYTDSTGLIYLINRYYDPTTDEFLSIDPNVATTDQPYVFTNDDPLNAEDPLGLICLSWSCIGNDLRVNAEAAGSALAIVGATVGTGAIDDEGQGLEADDAIVNWFDSESDDATTVYRVHGGDAAQDGASWTPKNPTEMTNPRDELGLPDGNSGEFVSKAKVLQEPDVIQKAAELDGNAGGAEEWKFFNPSEQLRIESTTRVNPHY